MRHRPPRPVVPVVAAVIRRGDAVLLGLRPAAKRHGLMWEFPGGKVVDGESFAEALSRELEEELRVSVIDVREALFVARDPGSPFEIHFVPVRIAGTPRAVEHEELRWADSTELGALPLAPADARFANEVLAG